ncbi:hypothetical protein Tco_0820894 [Tanacetum coccineum]|uniref:Uncharacterized protein n=1 Tax=Tanacetum coccineum TaxID=301880 RepID=A0ABQ5AAQ6_9ASTR
MHEDFEYVKSLENEVDELESEKADFSNMYDLLIEECVSKDVTCSYLHSLSDLNAYAELQCFAIFKLKILLSVNWTEEHILDKNTTSIFQKKKALNSDVPLARTPRTEWRCQKTEPATLV